MKNITIIEGDITKAKVDAIVNAANTGLLGGGGVDGAIHKAAGLALLDACRQIKKINGMRCPAGEARITLSGNLPSQHVIHTVGPIYHQTKNPKFLLESAYYNSLALAKENHCTTIAFPAISCGVYGYPPKDAAHIAFNVCSRNEFTNLQVFFYLYGDQMYQLWKMIFDQRINNL